MKIKNPPLWHGFTVQLFATTVLPLTIPLLVTAFGSVSLHQKDMRSLVGQRDERAVKPATSAIESELHHRMASISSLAAFAESSGDLTFEKTLVTSKDFTGDFDGGVAFIDSNGNLMINTGPEALWNSIIQKYESDPFGIPYRTWTGDLYSFPRSKLQA